jgi:hypothetical protein
MTIGQKNIPQSVTDLGLGDMLKAQLEAQTEEARKSALKNQGSSDALLSMSPATRDLFNFLGGNGNGAST